ncbi:carboxymuconolactone decarboxylase family protein [Neoroseomonas oryzicola]|uniref:Peroxidase-related enzyme n=1 Tax=Neoroseomonas oryzicola TaxID=535904 RepID=A0A9X9WII0_9PROT|nr:peroxidase-related enzyme [Neoroseomonas oryzicola]MBR0660140.1 peroxidase-related enzyme [Neoroseomonas oryzicola]NKE19391.1 peroxidase-related enzyme [Neoroseomonas oryzicola]
MSRIPTPATIAEAPEATRPQLEAVQKQLGSVPNLFRLLASSPAALNGYLGLSGALGKGALDVRTRERIALAVAEFNGCGYCLAAHAFIGANMAKLDAAEIAAARAGRSADPKADAAVRFAIAVTEARGRAADADLAAVRAAGWSDAEILEIVAHVALNTLTNYVNEVARTEVDFPAPAARAA